MVLVTSRHRIAVLAAVLSAAALAGTLVALRDVTPAAALRPAAAPVESPVDAPSPEVSEESPTPTPSPTATTTTTTASPAPAPLPTILPTVVPTAVPTVVVPTLPVPDPVVEVTPSAERVGAGTKMTLTVRWLAKGRPRIKVDPGDGNVGMYLGGCYGTRYDVHRAGPYLVTTLEWSYRRPGTYTVSAHTLSSDCDTGVPAARSVPRKVVVTAGPDVANGPWSPHAELRFPTAEQMNANPGTSPNVVWFATDSWDPDGWTRSVLVDFHDGTPAELFQSFLEDCASSDFPDTTYPWGGRGGVAGSHETPGPGTYDVTVTVTSSACDGGDAQTTSIAGTVVVTG